MASGYARRAVSALKNQLTIPIARSRSFGLVALFVLDRPHNRDVLQADIEHFVMSALTPGDIVGMDNPGIDEAPNGAGRHNPKFSIPLIDKSGQHD